MTKGPQTCVIRGLLGEQLVSPRAILFNKDYHLSLTCPICERHHASTHSLTHAFIHSFNCFLSIHYVPSTVLDAEFQPGTEQTVIPAFVSLSF